MEKINGDIEKWRRLMGKENLQHDLCGFLVMITCGLEIAQVENYKKQNSDMGDWINIGRRGWIRAAWLDKEKNVRVLIEPTPKGNMFEAYATNVRRD